MVFIMDRTRSKIKVLDLAMGKTEDEYTVELTNQGICFAVNDNDEIYAVAKKGIFLLENGKMTEGMYSTCYISWKKEFQRISYDALSKE